MKKFSAILLAVIMMLSMVAMASGEVAGSITITNATVGEKYTGYKVFNATYSDAGSVTYTISESDAWYNLVSTAGSPFTLTHYTANADKEYTVTTTATDTAIATWFNNIEDANMPAATLAETTATSQTVVWGNVAPGYYFVTSTLNTGANVTITTAQPNATIIDKNQGSTPGNGGEVKVIVNADGSTTTANSANVGDTVNFKLALNAVNYKGDDIYEQYTATDTLGTGFTLKPASITVKITETGKTTQTLNAVGTDVETATEKDTYKVVVNGNTFTVTIPWSKNGTPFYDANTKIEITYSAVINEEAQTGADNDTLKNSADFDGIKGSTQTTTFEIDIVKTDKNDNKVLTGAQFKLWDAAEGGNEIKVVKDDDVYRVATEEEKNNAVVIDAGNATIKGLAAGTYYLEEVKAPDGYNPLTARKPIVVSANAKATVNEEGIYSEGGVEVENAQGSPLPSTGGMGTTLFYVVGSLMMATAVVVLVAKKKVAKKKDAAK